MLSYIAPAAGLIAGLLNLGASMLRFHRGTESGADLVRWAGIAMALPVLGWQFRTLGLVSAIGYPLILLSFETFYFVRRRRAGLPSNDERARASVTGQSMGTDNTGAPTEPR